MIVPVFGLTRLENLIICYHPVACYQLSIETSNDGSMDFSQCTSLSEGVFGLRSALVMPRVATPDRHLLVLNLAQSAEESQTDSSFLGEFDDL